MLGEDEGDEESSVHALKNPVTGQYFQNDKFQLISAGSDGYFGTEDDIANFEIPESGK